jgi:hypothetical protein
MCEHPHRRSTFPFLQNSWLMCMDPHQHWHPLVHRKHWSPLVLRKHWLSLVQRPRAHAVATGFVRRAVAAVRQMQKGYPLETTSAATAFEMRAVGEVRQLQLSHWFGTTIITTSIVLGERREIEHESATTAPAAKTTLAIKTSSMRIMRIVGPHGLKRNGGCIL